MDLLKITEINNMEHQIPTNIQTVTKNIQTKRERKNHKTTQYKRFNEITRNH